MTGFLGAQKGLLIGRMDGDLAIPDPWTPHSLEPYTLRALIRDNAEAPCPSRDTAQTINPNA